MSLPIGGHAVGAPRLRETGPGVVAPGATRAAIAGLDDGFQRSAIGARFDPGPGLWGAGRNQAGETQKGASHRKACR
jgi:hypothetical protein